jgi:hypothetical protein
MMGKFDGRRTTIHRHARRVAELEAQLDAGIGAGDGQLA